ncbi:MAG: PspC domain-containing protein [Candidatus Nomurabacteria bacterium]|nr:PspC domain-containing protein [Candidatus Nomurabacteria bacterium]
MNEVTRIHLARVSYDIDVAAKKELEKYLSAVKRSLGSETDAMEDIEIRMTEILAERGVVKDSVITGPDIKAIIAQLGEPKEFASDEQENTETAAAGVGRKKYYRDTEHAVFGGVIAGLAAYTGWDVTLLRVLAVILTIIPSWGTLIIVYLVIWICAPEAKTVGEKLEMHGEPVNLGSIRDSAKRFGERAEVVGQEMTEKANEVGKKFEAQAPKIGSAIGRGILAFLGIIGLVVCASLIVALVIGSNQVLLWLVGADVAYKPLLTVAVSFAVALASLTIILGLVMSTAFMIGRFGKGYKRGLAVLTILVVVMTATVASLASSWVSMAGHDGVNDAVNQFVDDANVYNRDGSRWCVGFCR